MVYVNKDKGQNSKYDRTICSASQFCKIEDLVLQLHKIKKQSMTLPHAKKETQHE